MKTYHNEPVYEDAGKQYMKVGAYGVDDLEYIVQEDGSIYLPKLDIYYLNLETAYEAENEKWIEQWISFHKTK